jgi:hypothetical protein
VRRYFKQRFLLAVAFTILAAGCGKEANQNQSVVTTTNTGTTTAPPARQEAGEKNALIRLVDALPGSGEGIDLFADDTRVLLNDPYKEVTHYKEVPAGRHSFTIRPSNSATEVEPLAKEDESVSSGDHYTAVAAVATSGSTPSSLNIYSDNLTPPSTGKAKIRVIHASPDAGEVDVYAAETENKIVGGVNPGSTTGYSEVGPATVTLEVRSKGKETALTTVPNVKIDAGKIYSVVVLGRLNGTPKLEAILVEDQLGSGQSQ